MSGRRSSSNVALDLGSTSVSFDAEAFNEMIQSHGVQLVHYRAMRCPVGLIDINDTRRPEDDHSGCSNGFIFSKAGKVTCLFSNSGEDFHSSDAGFVDGSTAVVTASPTYDDSEEPVQVVMYDRFYLAEEAILVPHWQLVETHITGHDRLSFPALKVLDIVDSTGKRYSAGDYDLVDGQIIWKGSRPPFNSDTNRGAVYAIRYEFRPYFNCSRVMHQIRIAQIEGPDGRKVQRMPQQFQLTRETISLVEENDELAPMPNSPRQMRGPRKGMMGPR